MTANLSSDGHLKSSLGKRETQTPLGEAQQMGCYLSKEGVALRGSYIFDPEGKLCAFEVHHNSIGRTMEELLRKLQAAAFVRETGAVEVCPAGWRPGERTLKPSLDLVGKI